MNDFEKSVGGMTHLMSAPKRHALFLPEAQLGPIPQDPTKREVFEMTESRNAEKDDKAAIDSSKIAEERINLTAQREAFNESSEAKNNHSSVKGEIIASIAQLQCHDHLYNYNYSTWWDVCT